MNNIGTIEPPAAPRIGISKKRFGGKQEGAGRKTLPPGQKKLRIVIYVDPCVEEWVGENGGNKFAARLLTAAHTQSLIV